MFTDPKAVGSAALVGQTRAMKSSFYSCVYTLLGNQLRGMLSLTIQHYVELFKLADTTHLPQFKLHLCLEGQSMEFFPSIAELESAIVYVVETVATSMSNLSTIEVCRCVVPLEAALIVISWLFCAYRVGSQGYTLVPHWW